MEAYERLFASVFPPSADVVVPTPTATPVLGSTGPGESFGGVIGQVSEPESSAEEQIKWDRAWHTATTYLSLPNELITVSHAKQSVETLKARWLKPFTPEVASAVSYLISDDSPGLKYRRAFAKDNLLQWYYEEVGTRHYLDCVRPSVIKCLSYDPGQGSNGLFETIEILQVAQAIYLHPLKVHVYRFLPEDGVQELEQATQSLHNLFTHTITLDSFARHVSHFLREQASTALGLDAEMDERSELATIPTVREKTSKVMRSLRNVGMAGPKVERLFAEVMNEILGEYVSKKYAGMWSAPSQIPQQLRDWIENRFARFVVEVLACIKEDDVTHGRFCSQISYADTQHWQRIAVRKLGELRVRELFDIVKEWTQLSLGAIEDLKCYVREGKWRHHLTSEFSKVLSQRLLQPGASTTEILQVYIAIIRAFTVLDPKGVLLDRVARQIRWYLGEREDTISIVVGGLLADLEDDPPLPDVLYELAEELETTGGTHPDEIVDIGDLDFNDMMWEPDPVDAPLEYKKSKKNDVIGPLISLFDTKEAFIKEFQKILGERLLRKEHDFEKEIRVLELLKIRFGEASLQACEVMLRDIQDSRRIDASIHKDLNFAGDTRLQSKVLSHLFWPSLHTEDFNLPPPIASLQNRYSEGFSNLKASRKLTWLPSLGQVVVNLDLEDRVVREEVQTWQASVIYAFNSHSNGPVVKTVHDLMDSLNMSESFVRNALTFWVSKFVLVQSVPDTYRVLETLSEETLNSTTNTTAQAAAAAAASDAVNSAAASSALRSEEDMLQEKMEVYWNYVKAMLTNQGAMKLPKIIMMLKMVVPDGFPFGADELKAFLGGKVREGALEVGQVGYKIVH